MTVASWVMWGGPESIARAILQARSSSAMLVGFMPVGYEAKALKAKLPVTLSWPDMIVEPWCVLWRPVDIASDGRCCLQIHFKRLEELIFIFTFGCYGMAILSGSRGYTKNDMVYNIVPQLILHKPRYSASRTLVSHRAASPSGSISNQRQDIATYWRKGKGRVVIMLAMRQSLT